MPRRQNTNQPDRCAHCQAELSPSHYAHALSPTQAICGDCFSVYYTTCQGCNRIVEVSQTLLHREVTRNDDRTLCYRCFRQAASSDLMEYASQRFNNLTARTISIDPIPSPLEQNGENSVLWGRSADAPSRQPRIQENCSESSFQSGYSVPQMPNHRFMAVEIEAEGYVSEWDLQEKMQTISPYIDVGHDGSLNNGVEVTTPPASGSLLVEIIDKVTEEMRSADLRIERTCGLHVHIDMRDKRDDFTYLSNLFTTFFAIEDVLFAMQPQSRMNNNYCRQLRSLYRLYDFCSEKYIKDFDFQYYRLAKSDNPSPREEEIILRQLNQLKRDHYADGTLRYNGINLHSVFYRGTLEVRIHAGSLSPDKIINWCALLQAICQWTEKGYDPETMERLLALNVTKEKIDRMGELMGLSNDLVAYMKERIANFNHWNFSITYRKGMKYEEYEAKRKSLEKAFQGIQELVDPEAEDDDLAKILADSIPNMLPEQRRGNIQAILSRVHRRLSGITS